MPEYVGLIYVDINGKKGPNVWGRDIFETYIYNNGSLYSKGSKFQAMYNNDEHYWWKSKQCDSNYNCSTTKSSSGGGCAARIIEEGWQMNY